MTILHDDDTLPLDERRPGSEEPADQVRDRTWEP
jgi:hypothetical protein